MKSKGFTLIELIVVIVILGILAATALPKFVNFEPQARTATLQAVKASMEGAAALVYGKSLVKGNHTLPITKFPFITLDDGNLLLNYGYPLGSTTDWKRLIDYDENVFDLTLANDGSVIVYLKENSRPNSIVEPCITYYRRVSVAGGTPQIETVPCV